MSTTTRAQRAKTTRKPNAQAQASAEAPAETRPKYVQVADELREMIARGKLAPAALLPSEAQLSERYGVSRNTARNAIAALRRQGVVTVINGKGAFVRRAGDRPDHTDTRAIVRDTDTANDGYRDADADAAGWREVEKPSNYQVNAAPTLALAIGVAEHTALVSIDRLLEDPAGRRMLHRTYVLATTIAATPALQGEFASAGRLYSLLAEAGHAVGWTEYVTARNPSPDDANTLRVPDGTPVLITRRIIQNASGQPLAMEETHRSAEDTQLAYRGWPSSED